MTDISQAGEDLAVYKKDTFPGVGGNNEINLYWVFIICQTLSY